MKIKTCLLILFSTAGINKAHDCFTCIADSNNLLKCARPEYQGTYIKCPEDDKKVNTCFKSVNRISGEVNKGCAPDPKNKNQVYISDVGPWDERGVTTYYCNTKLCNKGASTVANLCLIIANIIIYQFFRA